MNVVTRTYRLFPTIIALGLFLVLGSILVNAMSSGPSEPTPEKDMYAVYYAICFSEEFPDSITTGDIRNLLSQMDEKLESVADRITVTAYRKTGYGFTLEATHDRNPSRTWLIDIYGIH